MPATAAVSPDFDRDVADVVIYSRYSYSGQNDQSIDGQIEACTHYAEQHGFRVVGSYIDRGLSGTHADQRPEFQRMIKDSHKHAFQYVLCWKLDRFARNRYDSAIYKTELKKQGVRVLSVTEGIDEGSESIILEAVLEAMAEEYSRQLSQNVRRGMQQNAEKLLTLGGNTPLGYKVEDKRLVVNESEADAVRYIFSAYASGVGKAEIARECNRRGWKTRRGKAFNANSFNVMLSNKTYLGIYSFRGKQLSADAVPAIVDQETYDKVQSVIARNRQAPAREKAELPYQLQGKLFCGYCGSPMIGECGYGRRGARYHYYTCSTRKKAHTCRKKNERKDFLEWYVVEQISTCVLTDSRIREIAAGVAAAYARDFDASGVKLLERQIRALDKEMDELIDTLTRTTAAPAVVRINDRIERLSTQKEEAELDLAKLKISVQHQITEEDVVAWLSQFTRGDPTDPGFRQRVIDVFVNSVYLYDDKIVMYFNIHNCVQVSYLDLQDDLEGLSSSPGSDLQSCGVPETDFDAKSRSVSIFKHGRSIANRPSLRSGSWEGTLPRKTCRRHVFLADFWRTRNRL